jgi:hypothetical protein
MNYNQSPSWEIASYIEDIEHLTSSFGKCSFEWVPRPENAACIGQMGLALLLLWMYF